MRAGYLEMMRAHCDEGGTLSHRNGLDLLQETETLRSVLCLLKVAIDREGWPAGWGLLRKEVTEALSDSPSVSESEAVRPAKLTPQ